MEVVVNKNTGKAGFSLAYVVYSATTQLGLQIFYYGKKGTLKLFLFLLSQKQQKYPMFYMASCYSSLLLSALSLLSFSGFTCSLFQILMMLSGLINYLQRT